MGLIIRPSYFQDFKCIASRCTDSCCQGWEIDIDEDTLDYYRGVRGSFGKRLREHIEWNTEEDEELPHFIQGERERCPFLNEKNLCDIFIHLGEEHLSQICTHHPRYYDWFLTREEGGLGLCCEEAARLILTCRDPYGLVSEEDGQEEEEETDEDLLFEQDLLRILSDGRERIFDRIRNGKKEETIEKLIDDIWQMAQRIQDVYEDMLFPETAGDSEKPGKAEPEAESVKTECAVLAAGSETENSRENNEGSFCGCFWNKAILLKVLSFLKIMEINDMVWWKTLSELEQHVDELLLMQKREDNIPKERREDYGRLLFYFLYRHFMKAREDDDVISHTAFALGSVCLMKLLDLNMIRKSGTLSEWDQICLAKLYSKEIEYDEENTLKLSQFLSEIV